MPKKILIVGAGPTGLMLAHLLRREGIDFTIVDKKSGPHMESRALAIQPRSLEIFQDLGFLDRFLEVGKKIHGVKVYIGIKKAVHVNFNGLHSPTSFLLVVPQKMTEQILIDELGQKGVEIGWNTEINNVNERKDHLLISIQKAGQVEHTETFDYIIACDGIRSEVRECFGISFAGREDNEHFVLADVKLEGPLSENETSIFYTKKGMALIIPMPQGMYRIIFNNASEISLRDDPSSHMETMKALAAERIPFSIAIKEMAWISQFSPQYRMVNLFEKHNVFLAGDAAHMHSPAGGQGMNTGFQDVYNLGWKLARMIRGNGKQMLIESYAHERMHAAREILRFTRAMTEISTLKNPLLRMTRNYFLSLFSRGQLFQDKIKNRIAQLSLNYRMSDIVMEMPSKNFWSRFDRRYYFFKRGPKAGDRALDSCAYLSNEAPPTTLYTILSGCKHVFLLFAGYYHTGISEELESSIDKLRQWLSVHAPDETEIYLVTRELGHAFFHTWEEGLILDKGGIMHMMYRACFPCMYLIRPDKYIGLRDYKLSVASLKKYFEQILFT